MWFNDEGQVIITLALQFGHNIHYLSTPAACPALITAKRSVLIETHRLRDTSDIRRSTSSRHLRRRCRRTDSEGAKSPTIARDFMLSNSRTSSQFRAIKERRSSINASIVALCSSAACCRPDASALAVRLSSVVKEPQAMLSGFRVSTPAGIVTSMPSHSAKERICENETCSNAVFIYVSQQIFEMLLLTFAMFFASANSRRISPAFRLA
ncbi:hypothetical protein SAMN02744783_04760 [Serratia sp. CC22-02]|nr:hypothetical protein SAMN02744783_04760 [Serratia sp. CC22-02]